jgi:hypothetical protein
MINFGLGGDMSNDNLELWSQYFNPPKDALKDFTRKGGFRGTAIDPMWLIRSATETWGPMGDTWGMEVIDEGVIEVSGNSYHWLLGRFYHPGGSFQAAGGTEIRNDEFFKMSLTDALAKALSWLGFGAAVHMGAFDGNKYTSLPEMSSKTKGASERSAGKPATSRSAGAERAASPGSPSLKSMFANGSGGEVSPVATERVESPAPETNTGGATGPAAWPDDYIEHYKQITDEAERTFGVEKARSKTGRLLSHGYDALSVEDLSGKEEVDKFFDDMWKMIKKEKAKGGK